MIYSVELKFVKGIEDWRIRIMQLFTSVTIAIAALTIFANDIQSANVQLWNSSSAKSYPLIPPDSVPKGEFNFEQTFQGCNNRKSGCVAIQGKPTSSCLRECAVNVQQLLKNEGFTTQLRSFYDSPEHSACVGYRPDLGGNRLGAQYIANMLTERLGVKYVVSSVVQSCSANGWPYSVILH